MDEGTMADSTGFNCVPLTAELCTQKGNASFQPCKYNHLLRIKLKVIHSTQGAWSLTTMRP